MYNKNKKIKGFTLIEILVVISIIAIVTGVVLVAINPAKRTAQADDVQRLSDVQLILSAVYNYRVDHNWQLPNCENSGYAILNDDSYSRIGSSGVDELDCYTDEKCRAVWTMEEASLVKDHSQNNNTAVPQGDAFQTDGLYSKAFEFDPDPTPYEDMDYLGVDDDDSLDITGKITLAAWIYPHSTSEKFNGYVSEEELRTILFKGGGDKDNYHMNLGLFMTESSYLGFGFNKDNTPGGVKDLYSDEQVAIDEWSHVAATFNKYDSGEEVKLYINGQPSRIHSIDTDIRINEHDLLIGRNAGYAFIFDGMIDDVLIVDEALTGEEIEAIYNFGYFFCDLEKTLVDGHYLSEMPQDPKKGTDENSGYVIKISQAGGISVKAPHTSQYAKEMIEVSF